MSCRRRRYQLWPSSSSSLPAMAISIAVSVSVTVSVFVVVTLAIVAIFSLPLRKSYFLTVRFGSRLSGRRRKCLQLVAVMLMSICCGGVGVSPFEQMMMMSGLLSNLAIRKSLRTCCQLSYIPMFMLLSMVLFIVTCHEIREYLLFKADNDALQAENQKLHAEVGWLKLLLLHLFKQLLLLHCPYMFHKIKA
ncbi:hypothetical protein LWI29_013490 [Acer saccharum]|uniref:Uncharacterized protein n=1 Tax=Acer saccharum TaxID=4024 RepID=A0AA39W1M9_ACESA|nr:hypothetical protein LWI29_013490 [Acer saccharum]